jgi:pyruvate,water dikinase
LPIKNWLKNLAGSFNPRARLSPEEAVREKYDHFHNLLHARKKALAMLALPPPLDLRKISFLVGEVLHSLNALSEQKYSDPEPMVAEIEQGNPIVGDVLDRAHDRAIEEMFTLLDKCDLSKAQARRVKTGLPIYLHVIDLGGGLTSGEASKILNREQILSVPMQALFKGMYYPGITWSGPIGINLKGFMVIMAQSTSRPEEDFWDKTYALVSREYMSYHSRLGYHYSSVDAYCSDEAGNNHIRFMFKGGAADDLRRAFRARFIGGVLERIGFAVEVQGDLVNARFLRQTRPEVEAKLDLLGRLMGCSRQRDMVMNEESIVNWYIEAFLRGNYSFTPDD